MIKAVVFDLDGTLLGLDNNQFGKPYVLGLHKGVFEEMGYDVKTSLQLIFNPVKKMVESPNYSMTNIEQFYFILKELIKPHTIEPVIERISAHYNTNLYDDLANTVVRRQEMIEAVKILKEKGYRVGICTNPMFPRIAIQKRIKWAGFEPSDFEFVTYSEETHSLKPNLSYYEETFKKYLSDLNYEEIMMVGNDVEEDMIASKLGLKTYLIKDYMISREGKENEVENQGSGVDFLNFVKEKM